MSSRPKPVILAIMDGWGIAPAGPGNAITQALTPNLTNLWTSCVHTQLIAHGESVGLPKREPGNTETGHLNLGAGRIVYQDLPRINMAIADGSFFQTASLVGAVKHVKQHQSKLHLMGLVGGGGVHSDLTHFFALIRECHEQGLNRVYLHLFTDGRDSPPTAAMTYINQLKSVIEHESVGVIASVSGRYYAMDRDFRWDRIAKAYFCITEGKGKTATSIEEAVSQAYSQNQTDEFIEPTIIVDADNKPLGLVEDNDAAIFVNFRIDRPRELTKAFVLPDFSQGANTIDFDPYLVKYAHKHELSASEKARNKPFDRPRQIQNLFFVTMTEYEKNLPVHVVFPPQGVDNPIGKIVSDYDLKQLRICESEKERFVTYYFNGLNESAYPSEERVIIPSPKVPTYDKKPEMSAMEIADRVVSEIQSQKYDFIVINFANADMVGHTGNISAAIKACQYVDTCIGKISEAILAAGGVLVITADHGNAEEMLNLTDGGPDTEHNSNPVPLIVVGNDYKTANQISQGIPADVSPTLLGLLQIPIPISMTGRNLLANI